MTWSRAACAAALLDALTAQTGDTVTVFPKPPFTVNPPAIVIGRPTEVRYTSFAFGIDEADLPVLCVGPPDGEDIVDGLITQVREAVNVDLSLGGVVACVGDTVERNWRNLSVAGVDILQAEVTLTIQM